VEALAARGVRAGIWNPTQLRLVTHRHIGDDDVEQALGAFRAAHAALTPSLERAG
jgi:hypothetical protein